MKEAAAKFVGKHDFKDFSTVKKTKSTVKEIYLIDIYQDAKEIQITIKANDFLHNMARMMVSTLMEIGLESRNIKEIEAILDTNSTETASVPANAQGLFLQEIEY
jgi:tRNA pseudouridine38-40 synthase